MLLCFSWTFAIHKCFAIESFPQSLDFYLKILIKYIVPTCCCYIICGAWHNRYQLLYIMILIQSYAWSALVNILDPYFSLRLPQMFYMRPTSLYSGSTGPFNLCKHLCSCDPQLGVMQHSQFQLIDRAQVAVGCFHQILDCFIRVY